jgi:4-diphosphocytidyl-2C-methyl-D-erythritol kinase
MPLLFNDLEPAAFRANPELAAISEHLNSIADGPLRMTGSGSAFFRLLASQSEANKLARRVADQLKRRAAVATTQIQ